MSIPASKRLSTEELLDRLIAFDTTSSKSNLALIDFVADYLDGIGFETRVMASTAGDKANLFATLGPQDVPAVLLSGHTDVVPADDRDWSSDPFIPRHQGNRVYGRGSCDMKGFIASVLAMAPEAARTRLRTPLQLAFSYDEEVGCIGGRELAKLVSALPLRPVSCIVGEPTGMRMATHHKGKKWYRCHVRGCAGHSSAPDAGVNAIDVAARLVVAIRELYEKVRAEGPFDKAFEPPHTTLHTGAITGGTSYNVIPRDCRFEFEFRHLPQHDPAELFERIRSFANDKLVPAMRAVASDSGVEFELVSEYPGLRPVEGSPATELARGLLDEPAFVSIGFSTEAGLFQEAGTAAVVCGPGEIGQAHKPNEFITVEQLRSCDRFLANLLERCRQGIQQQG